MIGLLPFVEACPNKQVDEVAYTGPKDQLHGVETVILLEEKKAVPKVILHVRHEDVAFPNNLQRGAVRLQLHEEVARVHGSVGIPPLGGSSIKLIPEDTGPNIVEREPSGNGLAYEEVCCKLPWRAQLVDGEYGNEIEDLRRDAV